MAAATILVMYSQENQRPSTFAFEKATDDFQTNVLDCSSFIEAPTVNMASRRSTAHLPFQVQWSRPVLRPDTALIVN